MCQVRRPSQRRGDGKGKPRCRREALLRAVWSQRDPQGGEPDSLPLIEAGQDLAGGGMASGGFRDDVIAKGRSAPRDPVRRGAKIADLGGSGAARGLGSRSRVGPLDQPVETIHIERPRPDNADLDAVISSAKPPHRDETAVGGQDAQVNPLCGRRPDQERGFPFSPAHGTQRQRSVHSRPPRPVLPRRGTGGSPLRTCTGSSTGTAQALRRLSGAPLLRQGLFLAGSAAAPLGGWALRVGLQDLDDFREVDGEAFELLVRQGLQPG